MYPIFIYFSMHIRKEHNCLFYFYRIVIKHSILNKSNRYFNETVLLLFANFYLKYSDRYRIVEAHEKEYFLCT